MIMSDLTYSTSNLPPLHTEDPLRRFSNRADDYAKYRPSYPDAAIDAILAGLGDPTNLVVADIGAGTGISSRLVANRGASVWAIEPNDIMRRAAEPHNNVDFREGTAEQTGLPDQSVDIVLCCQSFHWFNPDAALAEFHRILKPAGRAALMWNDRDRNDEFTNQYTEVIRKAVDPRYFERIERKASDAQELQQSTLFENFTSYRFTNSHWLNQAGLIGLALSASYVPKAGPAHQQLIADLQQLYHHWTDSAEDGVTISYQTDLYLANSCN
jgi:ubiquinone/menaquinone biosynthesis C-methylase UbiE